MDLNGEVTPTYTFPGFPTTVYEFLYGKPDGTAPPIEGSYPHAVVKGLFNGAENLNVTTHAVNQSKKGPFSRWRHQRAKAGSATIDDIVRETEAGKGLVDDGHWERITKAVVSVWDELEQRKEEIRAARAREHAEAVLKQMHLMMEGMALT